MYLCAIGPSLESIGSKLQRRKLEDHVRLLQLRLRPVVRLYVAGDLGGAGPNGGLVKQLLPLRAPTD